jgi:hypothetical protein
MKRIALGLAALLALALAGFVSHFALIESSGEVIVLRTEDPDGQWYEARLWIVDDGPVAWLHGADSRWMLYLEARPTVEIVRGGEAHRYHASPVWGPHPRVHELLRAKYGLADRWVRFIGRDGERTRPVKLERIDEETSG